MKQRKSKYRDIHILHAGETVTYNGWIDVVRAVKMCLRSIKRKKGLKKHYLLEA